MTSDQEKTDRAPVTQAAPGYRHTVLVVDDDAPTGKAIGRILERAGLTYTYVASGEEGLTALENAASPSP